MRMRRIAVLISLALFSAGCGGAIMYEASDVPSGRMVVLLSGERVVVDGIAAPVEGEEGFQDSRDMLKRVVSGKQFRVVRRGVAEDGSTVAELYVEGMKVSDVMVALSAARRAKTPRKRPKRK